MANQIEGLNGTRSTYMYENIEIVEIDGVRMVRRLKDKKNHRTQCTKERNPRRKLSTTTQQEQTKVSRLSFERRTYSILQRHRNVDWRICQRFNYHQLSSCVEFRSWEKSHHIRCYQRNQRENRCLWKTLKSI